MSNITRESFEATIASLLNANPRNSAKGNAMKDWFMNSFALTATVSHVKENKQIGNRVKEQFGHKAEIVIFVCNSSILRGSCKVTPFVVNHREENLWSGIWF